MLWKLILTGILASTWMFAQGGGGGGRRGSRGGEGAPMMPLTGSRLDRIADALKLNKEQKKGFKSSFDEAQKEVAPLHEQWLKGRDAIAEAVAEAKKPEEITPLVTAQSGIEAQIVAIELRAFAAVYKSLDKDQQSSPGIPVLFASMKGLFNGKNWNTTE